MSDLNTTTALVAPTDEVPAPGAQASTDPMIATIERIATDPNADIAKLEKMLDMKERIDNRARDDRAAEARRKFFADLTDAQSSIPVVVKNRKNTFNQTSFADLAAIEASAMPVIRDHGFSVSAKSIPGGDSGMQRIRFRVAHRDGHVDEFEDDFPLDSAGTGGKQSKTGIQAKGSTVTYARRYMLCSYFNIAVADSDGVPQRAEPTTISAKDAARIRHLIEATGTDEARFLSAARAASVEEIDAGQVDRLVSLLERKLKEAANA